MAVLEEVGPTEETSYSGQQTDQLNEGTSTQPQASHPPPLSMGTIPDVEVVAECILSRMEDRLLDGFRYDSRKSNFIRDQYGLDDKFGGELDEDWPEALEPFINYCVISNIKANDRHLYMRYSMKGDA